MGAMATSRPLKTVDDFMALGDQVRAELIAGEIYMSPSPSSQHQSIAGNLYVALRSAARRARGEAVFIAPLDVHLPSGDIVQPDVMFVSAQRRGIVQEWIRGAPDLLIEIVSPSHAERDRIVKRELYARNRVPEYWLVDGTTRTLERFVDDAGTYTAAGYYREGDTLETPLLPALQLPIVEIFADA